MSGKVIIVSQHYPPDLSTTAVIMSEIANHLAAEHPVLVLSGAPGSQPIDSGPWQPVVIQINNRIPGKAALTRRAIAELCFSVRASVMLLRRAKRGDVVLTVTAPFMLPYAVVAAAKLKGARSALIMHDLYPDVLVMTRLLKPLSLIARAIRGANALMFRILDVVITVGRDTEPLLLHYGGLSRDKIRFIPNWATLVPAVRVIKVDNPYRPRGARFVVGLSGNLGFTHDPAIVFEAARLLRNEDAVHFLLSGWGVGFERLKQLQSETNLRNVTLIERVADDKLEQLLSAANVWIIPYRRKVVGVSVPSRFYNLLAVGRPVILISEPDSEAALTITEKKIGWVVTPDRADELVDKIRVALLSSLRPMAERAVDAARDFSLGRAMADYAHLIGELLHGSKPERAH